MAAVDAAAAAAVVDDAGSAVAETNKSPHHPLPSSSSVYRVCANARPAHQG